MAPEKEEKVQEETEEIEKTVDPYTGELKPVPEDADQFVEVIPQETDDRKGSNYLLNEETSMDSYVADADADAVAEQTAHYTEDEDIQADFAQRQKLAVGGRNALLKDLDQHNSLSPEITGGDLDASWQTANQAGEETVGGSAPTPDQDIVDDLGKAAGLTYRDDEPLDSDRKVLDRDRNRWELDPASALDEDEDLDELGELDELDEDEEEGELDSDRLDVDEDDDFIEAEIKDEDEDV